jgi:alkanesulfonate monooxygenase SsuD/methylene tetrahydromethanopterin reductase-like flavin-dependent oxidoreductase (luciferase family)
MQLGMFMQPVHDPKKPWLQALREDQEAVRLADRLGFSEAWIGEHYSSYPEGIISPMMFLATLISQTKSIKFGTGVINLPHHHPAAVAAEAALFDQLAEGRFLFGIGPGGLPSDSELFGHEDAMERTRMAADAINVILQIWQSDPPYDIDSKYWPIKLKEVVYPELGIGEMPKPFQKPHPPVAMSVMSPYSGSAKVAGMKGWIPVSAQFLQARHVPTHWAAYAEGAEKAGRRPDRSLWRVGRSILVTETDQAAADYVADETTGIHFYFHYLLTLLKRRGNLENFRPEADTPDDQVTVPRIVDTVLMSGSPKTVLDKLVAFRESTGHFGTLIMGGHDWDRPEMWTASMRLLAEQVMPKFSRHAAQTMAAE